MDAETYQSFPKTIEVREVKVHLDIPGFRTSSMVVVTTMIDCKTATKIELAELYRYRWNVELDLRNIKIMMQMEILRCKSPSMIRKEIWAHLIAYNMIRRIIYDAAKKHNIHPRHISFKHTVQTLNAYQQMFAISKKLNSATVYHQILNSIAQVKVMNRPNRFEPRAKNRRPKQLDRLMLPRVIAKQRILNKMAA